jgi:uncharacterized protein (DUF2147 family)
VRRKCLTVRDWTKYLVRVLPSSHLRDPQAGREQVLARLDARFKQQGSPGHRDGHGGGNDFSGSAAFHVVPWATTFLPSLRRRGFAWILRTVGLGALAGIAVFLAIGFGAWPASATPQDSPLGVWSTANGQGVIAIDQCGDALCGRIVGIERKPMEPMPTNTDGHSQCGLTIITNERLQPDGTWLGQITDPRDNDVYHAKLWLDAQGNLRLRGFIGIPALGATQTWHRFTGHLAAACGLA